MRRLIERLEVDRRVIDSSGFISSDQTMLEVEHMGAIYASFLLGEIHKSSQSLFRLTGLILVLQGVQRQALRPKASKLKGKLVSVPVALP